MTPKHITFIVNPVAGRGKTKQLAEQLRTMLLTESIPHTILETTRPGEGTILARQASNTSDLVIAVGGDGTVNEVAAGVINSETILGVISEGSGNDFGRLVNAPNKIKNIIQLLSSSEQKYYDAGTVRLTFSDGTVTERYFFNSLGLGFDAAVAKHVAQITWLRGLPLYGVALIQTLIGYKAHEFTVSSDEYKKSGDYFLVCVGNGPWEGGGFKVTPAAIPDDGKFQICCVRGKSVWSVLPILPFTLTGAHVHKKIVDTFDSTSIVVESKNPFPIHGDGEIFGTNILKAEIQLIPKVLKVAVAHTQ